MRGGGGGGWQGGKGTLDCCHHTTIKDVHFYCITRPGFQPVMYLRWFLPLAMQGLHDLRPSQRLHQGGRLPTMVKKPTNVQMFTNTLFPLAASEAPQRSSILAPPLPPPPSVPPSLSVPVRLCQSSPDVVLGSLVTAAVTFLRRRAGQSSVVKAAELLKEPLL